MSLKTAAILIIGDENSSEKSQNLGKFLTQELTFLEYSVSEITVIHDSESLIEHELQTLIKISDIIVAISGKCGSLYKTLSQIISQELRECEDLVNFFKQNKEDYSKDDVCIPVQAKLTKNASFPVVYFQRIFILQEKYAKQSFDESLKTHLTKYSKNRVFEKVIQITQNGNSVSDLKEINKLSNNGVALDFSKNDQFYIIKISSSEFGKIVEFEEKIHRIFDRHRLRFFHEHEIWEEVYSSQESHVKNAIENIENCLTQYGPDNTFVSFNGGKDCTVLLHLVLTVLKMKFPQNSKPILCLYVQSDRPFPEQDEFISQAKTFYNLKITTIRSGIKEALEQTLKEFQNYRACFMGTRRTDPYSTDLNFFQMTDSNWPPIMRVSPLLDWHYSDIWDYLLYYKVPYCQLYDMGFTSLGNTVNTTRNPSLVYTDEKERKEKYLPAYKLLKEIKERNGRNSS